MNILPHKSWHVRTKANIARVRKDEAKAAEEEKERQRRVELAESEARTAHLREKAKQKFHKVKPSPEHQSPVQVKEAGGGVSEQPHEHVNLFRDVEEGSAGFKKTNEDREQEEKETREKYEKSIGYLTYLGQDTKVTSWYQTKRPRDAHETTDRDSSKDTLKEEEIQLKDKQRYDPLNVIHRVVGVQKPSKAKTGEQTTADYQNAKINVRLTGQDAGAFDREKKGKSGKRKRPRDKYETEFKKTKRKRSKRKESETETSDSSSSSSFSKYRRKKRKNNEKHDRKRKHRKPKARKFSSHSSEESSQEDSDEEEKRTQMEVLRQERLKRERLEKARAEKVLAALRGEQVPDVLIEDEKSEIKGRKQKYNSQYNPDLAKQNKNKILF